MNKNRTAHLILAATLATAGWAADPAPAWKPLAPMTSAPLTAPHQPTLVTDLVRDGHTCAVLLVPDAPAYAALADAVGRKLDTALGVALPRVPEAQFTPDGRTLILYGNVFTGPLVRRLYANHLVCADGAFPGTGYELRTVPNALDFGANVVFLGGSTADGVLAAADALVKGLAPADAVTLPHRVECRPSDYALPTPPTDASIKTAVSDLQKVFDGFGRSGHDKLASASARLGDAARGYLLTGDDAFGRLYAALLTPTAEFYQHTHAEPPTFQIPDLVMGLDQVEESTGMTPEDRLRAAEWLRVIAEDTMKFWEMRNPIRLYAAGTLGPIWNHETHPALGMGHAAQYLRTHYEVPATAYWEAVADHLFKGQVNVDQPLEDSANYQWLVHQHMTRYVLVTGRLTELLTGNGLRQHLEYAIASHNNLGWEATHGDAWEPLGSIAGASFAVGAAIFGTPRYGFMLDLIGRPSSASLWQFAGVTPSEAPADHVGLRLFTVHPDRVKAFGIEGIAPDRVLDKAVFRSGWDPRDEYLMLDGLNVGNHKHVDANAIISFVSNRRLWLTDMDYIRSAPKHHNSIAVTRDGIAPDQRPASRGSAQVIAAPPLAAERVASAAGDGMALTQTRLSDYAGLDWQRNLFWVAGNGIVVIDELTARQAGDYVTRSTWRTLGEADLVGQAVHARQRGELRRGNKYLRILEDAGRTAVELTHRDARIAFTQDFASGQHSVNIIAKGRDGSSDSLFLQLDDGAPMDYHIPQKDYGDSGGNWDHSAANKPLTVETAGPHRLTLTLREGPGPRIDAIAFTAPDGRVTRLEAEDLVKGDIETVEEPEQHLFLVNGDGSPLTLKEQFDYGHGGADGYYTRYAFAAPTTRIITQAKDQHLNVGDVLRYANLLHVVAGDPAAPRELRRLGDQRAWIAGGVEPVLVAIGGLTSPGANGIATDAQALLVTPRGLVAANARKVRLAGTEWSAPEPQSLAITFGKGQEGLAALDPAQVRTALQALYADTAPAPAPVPLRSLDAPVLAAGKEYVRPAPITALAAGNGLIVTGDEKGRITALKADGTVAWEQDAKARVRSVAPVRRADGMDWVAGTAAGDVMLFGPDGTPRWTYRCEDYHSSHGSVGTVFGADLDGNGEQETIAGSDNFHYHAFAADGKLLWRTETVHLSTVGCAADFNGDRHEGVVAGTVYYWPKLLSADGKILANFAGGPVTSAVAATDLDGDGKSEALVGMEDCFVRAAKTTGGWMWQANVGGTPTAIVPLPGKEPRLAVSTDGFGVAFLDGKGTRVAYAALPQAVPGLALAGTQLVAPCEDSQAYLISPDGKIVGGSPLPARPHAVATLDEHSAVVACGATLVLVPTGE